jgi:hypothetical protein
MKKIELKIKSCSSCPYLRYDSDYGRSYDSGYDCKNSCKRIIDDWEYNKKRTDDNYAIEIPDWCELNEFENDPEINL